jgi:cellulose synthase/poly-beta-1,6-N-acetylglucosamine synthase-like glycosyltransferase
MERHAQLVYTARTKSPGVTHHAKAGNINSALLNTPHATGDFVLVLDCDMIVHPEFLLRTLGHFYVETKAGNDVSSAKGQPATRWALKPKAALLQAPQDFWNVEAADPLGHCARFFYGPGLQGRDGANATPCCGTGVLFRRDILVSIGGQAYGSVTEDYNTAMHLLASGFANMYVNERLTFGMVPEDISGGWLARYLLTCWLLLAQLQSSTDRWCCSMQDLLHVPATAAMRCLPHQRRCAHTITQWCSHACCPYPTPHVPAALQAP